MELIMLILFIYIISGLFSKNPERRKSAQVASHSGGFIKFGAMIMYGIILLIIASIVG